MTATREIIAALLAGGMDAVDAAALLARAGAEMAAGPSKAALRTRRWRHKASQSVTGDAQSETVTDRHKASQTVTCDVSPKPPLTLSSFLPDTELQKKEEKKVRARKAPASPLPADWQPSAAHFEAAVKLHIPREAVFAKAEDMRLWAQSTGAVKADWNATFHVFLRRDASKLSTGNPHERADQARAHSFARPAQTNADAVLAGMARVAEKRLGSQSPNRSGDGSIRGRGDAAADPDAERGASEGDRGASPQLALIAGPDARERRGD